MDDKEEHIKILKSRYAKGEITKKEYTEMKADLKEDEEKDKTSSKADKGKPSHAVRNVVLVIILLVLIWLLLNVGKNNSYNSYTSSQYTTVPVQHTLTLFAQGDVFSINPGAYEFVNFTIPSTATGIGVTGSYSSAGSVEVGILTQAQYGAFTQNPSSISSSPYYYGDTQGATIDAGLAPGEYTLVFYDPGLITTDTVTVVNPITLTYTS